MNKSRKTPEDLTDCWKDDDRMNFLFSDFPADKETNPTHWKTKLDFWTTLIFDLYRTNDNVILSYDLVSKLVERKGQTPLGLKLVWCDMVAQKHLIPATMYSNNLASNSSWFGWGVNVFVRKPVSWFADKLLSPISRSKGFFSEQTQDFVNSDIIKQKSNNLLDVLVNMEDKLPLNTNTFIVAYDGLAKLFLQSDKSLDLLLLCLEQQKKISVYMGNTDSDTDKTIGQKYIKFSKNCENPVEKVSETDAGILKLKQSEKVLSNEIDSLYKSQTTLRETAQKYLQTGQKTQAKSALRQKHRTAVLIEKKETSLENIQLLLERIKQCETDQMIIKAYEAGKNALKDTMKNLPVDNVESTIDDLSSLIDGTQEISDIIATPISQNDISTEDLEKELEQLLNESGNKSESNKISDLSDAMAALNTSNPTVELPDLSGLPNLNPKESQLLSELG